MRSSGIHVHATFAQIAVVEDGLCRDEGRIELGQAGRVV